MDSLFRSKWFVVAVSLVFSILLFVFVNVETDDKNAENRFFGTPEDTQTVDNVPVDIRIDEDYVVSGVPENVSVSLEGPKSILTPVAKQQNFNVFVDLQDLGEGEHKVEMEYENISDDLQVYIEPKTVDVEIEERSKEEFPVNVDLINEDKLPEGYEMKDVEVEPETVSIQSSKSVVDQIALAQVYVDVDGLTEPIENREVPVNVYDSQGNELNVSLEPENVEVSADVNNPDKEVSLSVETTGDLPDDYSLASITPEFDEINVYGESDSLDDIDEVKTEDVDLSKIKESGTIDVDLALPDGVNVMDQNPVEVDMQLDQEKTIKDVPINVENEGDDQDVSFVDPDQPKTDVEASGKETAVRKLDKDDIAISVNLDELDDGEHDVPVTIDEPDDVELEGEFDEVTIDIS